MNYGLLLVVFPLCHSLRLNDCAKAVSNQNVPFRGIYLMIMCLLNGQEKITSQRLQYKKNKSVVNWSTSVSIKYHEHWEWWETMCDWIKSDFFNNTQLLPCIDVRAGQRNPAELWVEAVGGALIYSPFLKIAHPNPKNHVTFSMLCHWFPLPSTMTAVG